MRQRLFALPSALVAAALVLSACSSGGQGETTPSPSESSSTQAPAVDVPSVENAIAGDEPGFTASGAFGEKPVIEFGSPSAPEGLQVQTLIEGDGEVVGAGATVDAHYLGQVWGSDEVFDNSYDRGESSEFSLTSVIAGWTTGLVGQKVGSRVLLSIPSFLGYGAGGREPSIKPGDDLVFVVDIVGADSPAPAGQADATPTGAEVPVTITGDLGSPVTAVTVAEGAAQPTEATMTVLATGTGAAVAAGNTISLHYFMTSWDGTTTETTWPPSGIGSQNSPVGGTNTVFDMLEGVPVGSRVLLQLPGDAATQQPAAAVVLDVTELISG